MGPDFKSIGARIKAARVAAELTQEELAEKLDISHTHMSNLETGKSNITLTTLFCIADMFSMTVNDFLYNQEQKTQTQIKADIIKMLSDCNDCEIRIIHDLVESTKTTLRKNVNHE